MPSQIRIGADIGGTFTDIVFLDGSGNVRTAKVSSTPDDYARAISDTVADYLADSTTSPAEVVEINHGTTVATNAILERKGAPPPRPLRLSRSITAPRWRPTPFSSARVRASDY
jgi:N-methylhydantoinase A